MRWPGPDETQTFAFTKDHHMQREHERYSQNLQPLEKPSETNPLEFGRVNLHNGKYFDHAEIISVHSLHHFLALYVDIWECDCEIVLANFLVSLHCDGPIHAIWHHQVMVTNNSYAFFWEFRALSYWPLPCVTVENYMSFKANGLFLTFPGEVVLRNAI